MKRPTIAEIAAQAGVSIGAVSYALNGRPGVSAKTRQRILDIADEIGWRPSVAARSLSGSRAHSVGLVIARPADTLGVEPFFMRFIAGLEGELSVRRIALLLQVVEDHRAAIEAMRLCWAERRIDGMVVTDLWGEDSRIPVLEELQMPAVLVGRPRADTRLPAVWTDDAAAVDSAVDYLVALGHRRIARVAGLPALDHTQVRIAAFRRPCTGTASASRRSSRRTTPGRRRPGHPDAAVPPRPADRDHVRQRRDGGRRAQRRPGDGRRRTRRTVHCGR